MEQNLENTYKELVDIYKEFTPITEEELSVLMVLLNLDKGDPKNNSQILCHGAGESGVKHLDDILNGGGLKIKRDNPDSNNYVDGGLLSTNVCMNDPVTNEINISATLGYKYHKVNEIDGYITIITAIPVRLKKGNENITLGRIIPASKTRNCVLDDLGIESIPKEFILGVLSGTGREGEQKFKINENFFALSEKNFDNAMDAINNIFSKSAICGSAEEYYESIESAVRVCTVRENAGMPTDEILTKYQLEAGKLNNELNNLPENVRRYEESMGPEMY